MHQILRTIRAERLCMRKNTKKKKNEKKNKQKLLKSPQNSGQFFKESDFSKNTSYKEIRFFSHSVKKVISFSYKQNPSSKFHIYHILLCVHSYHHRHQMIIIIAIIIITIIIISEKAMKNK